HLTTTALKYVPTLPPAMATVILAYSLQSYGHHRDLHSFPTRRSSDLWSGTQEWLSFYFKCPMTAPELYPEHDLFIQLMKNTMRRSEEHTSELQSRGHLVCRLLLEKKKKGLRMALGTSHV